MEVLKCKMCGANLNILDKKSVVACDYCGSLNTISLDNDEQIRKLFIRANDYRYENDYDSAKDVYENILGIKDDAEAFWGLCLCKYGIEYISEPGTNKKVISCHRTRFKSILTDVDYQNALRSADVIARDVYEKEAQKIEMVQRKILEASRSMEPYDVFISYKEEDNNKRTRDSVLAYEIYQALVDEGYRVFFARVSLDDIVGSEYEPYIFQALVSAPVMILIGSKIEYINSTWVKNEWERFLAMKNSGQRKTLIPCYIDISPYDLPTELQAFQGQNMAEIGFIQDLVRGIKKIIGDDDTESESIEIPKGATFLDRAYSFIKGTVMQGQAAFGRETPKKSKVDSFESIEQCEKKYQTAMDLIKSDNLNDISKSIDLLQGLRNYKDCSKEIAEASNLFEEKQKSLMKQQVYRFLESNDYDECQRALILCKEIEDEEITTLCQNKVAELEPTHNMYLKGVRLANDHCYQEAALIFGDISGYRDSIEKKVLCLTEDERRRKEKEKNYADGCDYFSKKKYQLAKASFICDPYYLDSLQYLEKCDEKIRWKRKIVFITSIIFVIGICIAAVILGVTFL